MCVLVTIAQMMVSVERFARFYMPAYDSICAADSCKNQLIALIASFFYLFQTYNRYI